MAYPKHNKSSLSNSPGNPANKVSLAAGHQPAQVLAYSGVATPDGMRLAATAYSDPAFNPEHLVTGNGTAYDKGYVAPMDGGDIFLSVWPLFKVSTTPTFAAAPQFVAYGEFLIDPEAGIKALQATGATDWATEDFIPANVANDDRAISKVGRVWLPLHDPDNPTNVVHSFDQTKILKLSAGTSDFAYMKPVRLHLNGARRVIVAPTHTGGAAYNTLATNVEDFVLMGTRHS